MNKRIWSLNILAILCVILTACGQVAGEEKRSTPNERKSVISDDEITHEWGIFKLDKTPEKVITLDFSFIDTLTSIGVIPIGNAGVGTSKIPEYLNYENSEIADVGERKAPNLEVIQSLNPDLIIASVDRHSMIRKELEDISNTIALDDANYEQILENVKKIGSILNKDKEADKVISELNEKINNVKKGIIGSPTILVAGYFDDEFTVWIKDSFIGSLLTEIGFEYAFNGEKANLEGKGEGVKMTIERLHEIDPEFLMIYGDNPEKLEKNPVYKDLKAVKENKLVEVDRNLWSRGRGPIAADKIIDEAVALLDKGE
ncbi:ABC transporter substrate-binding protein [Niallia circulans]|uniref:ABC transporter substrate-binding protein n=1 Tax=Niallia circulans TaxID=1397 RepID=A0A941JI01_NIACI|nr:ABC transporter substrate-binding protein [Niallia circulans]MCB5236407.1 ABC transporter substrate-binding protein [Niallia circulans]